MLKVELICHRCHVSNGNGKNGLDLEKIRNRYLHNDDSALKAAFT